MNIPKFNHNLKWKKRDDRLPKTKPVPVTKKIVPPSIRQSDLTRQRSTDKLHEILTKRLRKETESQGDKMSTSN